MTRVLIADDDLDAVEALIAALAGDGFEFEIAPNGPAAIESAGRERPDVVVVDPTIPGTRGWDLCRRLRQAYRLPIIVVGGTGAELERIIALELGADDYVAKPPNAREMVARIKAVLRRYSPSEASDELRLGDVVLRADRREALVHQRPLELREKEFDLLLALAKNCGAVLSRQCLLRSVWGHTHMSKSRTVDVHVVALRKKLYGTRLEIQGVWRIGYRLVVMEEPRPPSSAHASRSKPARDPVRVVDV